MVKKRRGETNFAFPDEESALARSVSHQEDSDTEDRPGPSVLPPPATTSQSFSKVVRLRAMGIDELLTNIRDQKVHNPFVPDGAEWDRRELLEALIDYTNEHLYFVLDQRHFNTVDADRKLPIEKIEALNRHICNTLHKMALKTVTVQAVRKHHQKAVLKKRDAESYCRHTFQELCDGCQGAECNEAASLYTLLEGEGYDPTTFELQETNKRGEEDKELIGMCRTHHALLELFFTFTHMRWNVIQNSKRQIHLARSLRPSRKTNEELVAAVPDDASLKLAEAYGDRYFKLFVFGSKRRRRAFGCTLLLRPQFDSSKFGLTRATTKKRSAQLS